MKSNIRKLRNEKQISQTELANIIGKTQQTVSHMEKDRDRISIESLITMADYFGVSTDCVLGIEKEETPENSDAAPADNETLKKETEDLRGIAKSGDSKLIYDLILSLLLCSLEDQVRSF